MEKDSEQRSYSVDEMMEQLKKGKREKSRNEDAELVTRSDGSRVMRVRKRKRRRNQSSAGVRRLSRRYRLIFSIGIVVLLVGCGVALLLVMARYNSKGYRESVEQSLSRSTGAHVGLAELSVNPIKSGVKEVQFTWPAGGLPKVLRFVELDTRLKPASFLSSRLQGREVRAESGTLAISPPTNAIPPLVASGDQLLDFESYTCSQFELTYGTETEEPVMRLRGSELTARPLKSGDGLRFAVSGGFVRFGDWSELKVNHGYGEWQGGAFNLLSLYTRSGDSGEAIFKGVQPISRDGASVFDVQLIQFPLEELLGLESMGELFRGVVDGPSGSLTFDASDVRSGQLRVDLTGSGISIEGFRFLGGLASILRKEHYTRPEGGLIKATLNWNGEQMTIEDLEYEVRSHLMVTGSIVVRKQELSGRLQLGVPESLMMKSLTEPRYSSFSAPRKGYCWTDIELGGTVEQPNDNFLRKLEAAPAKPIPPTVPPGER